jgi:hypothetical protein
MPAVPPLDPWLEDEVVRWLEVLGKVRPGDRTSVGDRLVALRDGLAAKLRLEGYRNSVAEKVASAVAIEVRRRRQAAPRK